MSDAKMLFWLIVILAGACGIGWLALRLIRKYKTGENWALGVLILTAFGFLIYVLMARWASRTCCSGQFHPPRILNSPSKAA